MKRFLPVLIVVLSNTFYHICAKSTPKGVDTFASLAVTYTVGAVASLALYFLTRQGGSLLAEFRQLNWTSFVLGLAVVGLEAGFLLMYKVGWDISTAQIVQSAILAVVLLVVGVLAYREALSGAKVAGIVICLAGLYLLNR